MCILFLVTDGEPIKLPDNLESLPRADHFPTQRHRWNTNEVSGTAEATLFFARNFDIEDVEKKEMTERRWRCMKNSFDNIGGPSVVGTDDRQRKWYETVMDSRSQFFLLANQLA